LRHTKSADYTRPVVVVARYRIRVGRRIGSTRPNLLDSVPDSRGLIKRIAKISSQSAIVLAPENAAKAQATNVALHSPATAVGSRDTAGRIDTGLKATSVLDRVPCKS
jgi:hypothetical protein